MAISVCCALRKCRSRLLHHVATFMPERRAADVIGSHPSAGVLCTIPVKDAFVVRFASFPRNATLIFATRAGGARGMNIDAKWQLHRIPRPTMEALQHFTRYEMEN